MKLTQTVAQNRHPLLLWPNVIGYVRIVFLFIIIFVALNHPVWTLVLYFIAANLDAVDGFVARYFKQESKVGIILDYATDRGSDVVLFLILATLYKSYWPFFCALLSLDIFSHICQVYAAVFVDGVSHKMIGKQQGKILGLYYTNRAVLYFTCASHDLWLACLYMHYFYSFAGLDYLSLIFLPGFVFKTIIHVAQILAVFRQVSAMER